MPTLAQTQHLEGVVRDSNGKLVVGARVRLNTAISEQATTTDSNGKFVFAAVPAGSGTITVTSNHTKGLQRPWSGESTLDIVLHAGVPGFCCETCICVDQPQVVIVTATRTNVALDDSPADVVAIDADHLASTPALTLDDILRKVPGFTLFRRSSNRTANPSTQGASMRGLGASGTSRALVLLDEVPLNDPFGGWVYWDRVARESISGIEVVRGGGGASLYGSTALGGVIQFLTRQPEAPSVSVEGSWGNENTPELSAWAGTRLGPWNVSLAADLFRTDGYILVPENQRGPVDTPADSRHELTTVDLGRRLGDHSRIFARGSYFDEARHNGTLVQRNATQLADFSTGWNYDSTKIGSISTRLFGLFESYDQTFSSITSVSQNRDTDTLTNLQRVPSQSLGGNAQWSRPMGRIQTFVGGFEMREVHGSSDEDLFRPGPDGVVPNGQNLSGGRERAAQIFGEDIIQLGRLTANLSLGYDHWSDFDARRIHINTDGTFTLTPYAARDSDAINPRAALLYRLGHGTSLTASGYRAFRAPTLNELYRSFRQGNVITNNNPALRAERLTGVETGIRQSLLSDRLSLRGTFFWNDMTNTVVNVTLSTDPVSGLITRQKQNVGRTLSTGLNLDGEFRLTGSLQISGGYQYSHAVVSSYAPDPALENPSLTGNWIPQVPHQQFTLQARYVNPKLITATVQGTFVGKQFDDDLNAFPLDRYFAVDVYVSHALRKRFQVFVAAENLFNTRWAVAATPVTTLGPPLLARVGLRYEFLHR